MSDLKWQDAVSYSHNFATSKPDILPMEKEHILGLSKVLERVGSQRDELYECLSAFERVTELWLPAEVSEEHIEEAEALHGLRRKMLEALAKARGET